MTYLLKADKISKKYMHRDGVVNALQDISFEVPEKSFVTITGPSGSGKTTLLLALSGLIKATSGEIIFRETALHLANDSELAVFRKKNVGFIMQNFSLIPYLTALQNVMVPLAIHNIPKHTQVQQAEAVLELVGLKDRLSHYPRELSAGQQQRVAIARALVNKPSVIFADEPTGNLDPALSFEILDFLKDINQKQNITIFMVTHSPAAAEYGNIKIHLSEGRITKYAGNK